MQNLSAVSHEDVSTPAHSIYAIKNRINYLGLKISQIVQDQLSY